MYLTLFRGRTRVPSRMNSEESGGSCRLLLCESSTLMIDSFPCRRRRAAISNAR